MKKQVSLYLLYLLFLFRYLLLKVGETREGRFLRFPLHVSALART